MASFAGRATAPIDFARVYARHRRGVRFAITPPMPRRPRLQFPGAVYHVMSRGNRKSPIVEDDDDRRRFMWLLSLTVSEYKTRIYAACLMGNHYHLLLDTPRQNLPRFMRQLNGVYAQYYNRRHGRVGHTFHQRFHSIVVQREKYLRRVARYIVLNPVKAGLCNIPASWPWTTYTATIGEAPAPRWLYVDWLPWAFRTETLEEARRRFAQYVNDPGGLSWEYDLQTDILGTRRFVRGHRGAIDFNRLCDREVRGASDLLDRPPLEELLAKAVSVRCARTAAVDEAYAHGYTLSEIANFLGVHVSTVSRAQRRASRRGTSPLTRTQTNGPDVPDSIAPTPQA